MTLFTRDDLIDALRELVTELRQAGEPTGIRPLTPPDRVGAVAF